MSFLFDLDGTLVDSADSLIRVIDKVLVDNNLHKTSREENLSYAGYGLMHMFRKTCSARLLPDHIVEELSKEMFSQYILDPITGTKPYPNVYEVLRRLQVEGARIAVVTNKDSSPASKILSTCFPNIVFDEIYSPDMGWAPKPSQMSILDYRNRYPNETLTYLGDTEADWKTAYGVADKIFIATWGYRTREDLISKGISESCLVDDIGQILC